MFDATAATGSPASSSAWRFVPSPDASTPIIAALDPADHEVVARILDDRAVADPEVEDASQLVLLHMVSEPVIDGGPPPGVPVDPGCEPVRDDTRDVARDAAPRHVSEARARRTQPPDVVQVAARRGEQVVAVVVLVLEDAADEREPVRMHTRGGQADDDVSGPTREPSTSPSRSTIPTHVPAKSSSSSR